MRHQYSNQNLQRSRHTSVQALELPNIVKDKVLGGYGVFPWILREYCKEKY
jgi:hypothetical protein